MAPEHAEKVEAKLLSEFAWNRWFLENFWPENRNRILHVLGDIVAFSPPSNETRILDVGCFNGYATALFALSGYSVTGVDSYEDEHRNSLFVAVGRANYAKLNLNAEGVFADWKDAQFDIVFMGEVVEHILNWPLDVLQQIKRLLKPGGRLYLTTPNPATLLNSWRMITDRYDLRGTAAFATEPKIASGRVITHAEIHYREYTRAQIQQLVRAAGFEIVASRFIVPGARPEEPWVKRLVKTGARVVLPGIRLISSCQYLTCEKSANQPMSRVTGKG